MKVLIDCSVTLRFVDSFAGFGLDTCDDAESPVDAEVVHRTLHDNHAHCLHRNEEIQQQREVEVARYRELLMCGVAGRSPDHQGNGDHEQEEEVDEEAHEEEVVGVLDFVRLQLAPVPGHSEEELGEPDNDD